MLLERNLRDELKVIEHNIMNRVISSRSRGSALNSYLMTVILDFSSKNEEVFQLKFFCKMRVNVIQ